MIGIWDKIRKPQISWLFVTPPVAAANPKRTVGSAMSSAGALMVTAGVLLTEHSVPDAHNQIFNCRGVIVDGSSTMRTDRARPALVDSPWSHLVFTGVLTSLTCFNVLKMQYPAIRCPGPRTTKEFGPGRVDVGQPVPSNEGWL